MPSVVSKVTCATFSFFLCLCSEMMTMTNDRRHESEDSNGTLKEAQRMYHFTSIINYWSGSLMSWHVRTDAIGNLSMRNTKETCKWHGIVNCAINFKMFLIEIPCLMHLRKHSYEFRWRIWFRYQQIVDICLFFIYIFVSKTSNMTRNSRQEVLHCHIRKC